MFWLGILSSYHNLKIAILRYSKKQYEYCSIDRLTNKKAYNTVYTIVTTFSYNNRFLKILKVIHVHLVLRKMFIPLVWNDPTIFLSTLFSYNSVSFLVHVKFQFNHCFVIELQYNHILTL